MSIEKVLSETYSVLIALGERYISRIPSDLMEIIEQNEAEYNEELSKAKNVRERLGKIKRHRL